MLYDNGITAIIRSLGGGGAERVLTTMLNYWVEHGLPVSLITTTLSEEHAYGLDTRVRCICIPPVRESCLDDAPWDVKHLRQAIGTERHRICISFMEKSNLPAILAVSGLPIKLICSERTDPRTQSLYTDYKKSLVRRLYPLADALVVQTESVKRDWAEQFMPPGKTVVIHNMVNVDDSLEHPLFLPEKFICCMGRLTQSKGFSGFFSVLPRIFAKHGDYSVIVLGEGPERNNLSMQIASLGLSNKVIMPGFMNAPHSILKRASLFVFPSLYEGFPNALIEAMHLGLAPVSFDCPSGPAEIIRHGETGLLAPVNDYARLAESVIWLLDNPGKRKQLGSNARKWASEHYNLETIMRQWNDLIKNLLGTEETASKPVTQCIACRD